MLKRPSWTCVALVTIFILALIIAETRSSVDAKAFKKLSKALKMKRLKKYLPFMMMGPRVIIIQASSDPNYESGDSSSTYYSSPSSSSSDVQVTSLGELIRHLDTSSPILRPLYGNSGGRYQFSYDS